MTSVPKRLSAVAAFAAAIAILAGCASSPAATNTGTGESQAAKPAANQEVTVAITIEGDWDPLGTVGGGAVVSIASLVYDSLLRIDENNELYPGLAEEWNFSDDALTLTFKLRSGQTFSDGTAVTAETVAAHFNRAVAQSPNHFRNLESASATDDTTLVFTFSAPNYEVLRRLTQINKMALIASPTATEESLVTTPAGSGPYLLESQIVDDHAVLVKNPDYWNAAEYQIEKINFYPQASAASAVKSVQTGVYDLAWVDPTQLPEAEAAGLQIVESTQQNGRTIEFNLNKAPFDNPKVVEALKYAIDREAYVETLSFGYGNVTNQPVGEGDPQLQADLAGEWAFDPERAKSLLAEAGYDEANPLKFTFKIGETDAASAEYIKQQLATIGVDVTIETIPAALVFPEIIQKKNVELKFGFTPDDKTFARIAHVWGPEGLVNLSGPLVNETVWAEAQKLPSIPLDSPDREPTLNAIYRAATLEGDTVYVYEIGEFFVSNGKLSDIKIVSAASFGPTLEFAGVTVNE